MSAVKLKNITGLTLEGGPVTVYDGNTYAGEALFTTLKDKEERHVSYAVDLGTVVTTRHGNQKPPVHRVVVSRGMPIAHFKLQEIKTYTFMNNDDRDKTMVIEHPIRQGWELAPDLKPADKTESFYRFELELPKRDKVELAIKEEMPQSTTYDTVNYTPDLIAFFVQQKYIDEKLQKAFQNILAIKNEIASIDAQITQNDRDREAIFKDQERLRANIKALGKSAEEKELRSRYVKGLGQGEDNLQKLEAGRTDLTTRRQDRQKALDDALNTLNADIKV